MPFLALVAGGLLLSLAAAQAATLTANSAADASNDMGASEVQGSPPLGRFTSLSTKGFVESGDGTFVNEFGIEGAPKQILLRALGPSLPEFGDLADPILELRNADGVLIASNDDWRSNQEAEILATGLAPSNDLEAAIVATLNPNFYAAVVRGKDGGTGTAIGEIYALDAPKATSSLTAFGVVGRLGQFQAPMVSCSSANMRVLVRVLGPSLVSAGISDAVQNPLLELRTGNGVLLASNDNWRVEGQEAEIIASGLAPMDDRESAILATLPPDTYKAVPGAGDTQGRTIFVQFYQLPSAGPYEGSPLPVIPIPSFATPTPTPPPPTGFDPNANGPVRVVVVQPGGKILIGGDFTTLSPNNGAAVTRNHIARLNPDGTLDTAFDPNANNVVSAIALQADGKILVGGQFTSISGQTRNRIARLDAMTGSVDSFNPNANGSVNSIVIQTDGKILVGGNFAGIGGQTRFRIARLDGGLADSFNPNADGVSVHSIAVQTDGKILVGGQFTSIGGHARNRIARLDNATGSADSFDPNANSYINSIVVQADGKILVGGNFAGTNSIGGQTRNRIARLDATTGLADSFDPSANGFVSSIAVQADGKILVSGIFNAGLGANSIGGRTRNFIARLDATTGAADSFDPNANQAVNAIAVQADGKILAGGNFTSIGGQARNRIARLEAEASTSQPLNLSTRMRVETGDNVGIGGFIITGTSPKHVLLRAIGPSLTQLGVPNALADPVIELHGPGAFATITNNNWRDDPVQEAAILATGIPPTNDLESAIDATLAPGAYTAIVRGNGNTSGAALVEVYDLNQSAASKLANISTRAFVSTGDDIVIAGFILGGNSGDDRIVVRGIGPSLAALGVPNALADPTLELRDNNGALLASNNDWQDDPAQAAELTSAGLAPTNELESGIAATLPPGPYTALLAGLNTGTGIGLVEVYDRGAP